MDLAKSLDLALEQKALHHAALGRWIDQAARRIEVAVKADGFAAAAVSLLSREAVEGYIDELGRRMAKSTGTKITAADMGRLLTEQVQDHCVSVTARSFSEAVASFQKKMTAKNRAAIERNESMARGEVGNRAAHDALAAIERRSATTTFASAPVMEPVWTGEPKKKRGKK